MKDKWKVVKHGINYVEIFHPIICPECGNLIEKIDHTEILSGKWSFFDIFKKHWSEEHCVCPSCNCEISRRINKKLQVYWSKLFFIISSIGLCAFTPLFCIKEDVIFLILLLISVGVFIVNLIVMAIS